MEFQIQHNGKGKSHLLNNDFELLCKSKGEFNFSGYRTLIFENGNFFEKTDGYKQQVKEDFVKFEYCKKCLKICKEKIKLC
jgi:hypothetical protein